VVATGILLIILSPKLAYMESNNEFRRTIYALEFFKPFSVILFLVSNKNFLFLGISSIFTKEILPFSRILFQKLEEFHPI